MRGLERAKQPGRTRETKFVEVQPSRWEGEPGMPTDGIEASLRGGESHFHPVTRCLIAIEVEVESSPSFLIHL